LHGGDFSSGIDADLLRVELVERRVVLDERVAARLRDGGVVDFAVAVAAIADEVDDNIGAELVAIVGGDGGDAHDSFGVFGVDVEDGNRKALGEIAGEARGVRLIGVRGEAEQVVGDDLDCSADVVAVQRGEVQRFGGDALAGEGSVAVDDDGKNFLFSVFANAFLIRAGAAEDDGIYGFKMRRVRREMK
jgi:hypothetical protein